MRSVVIALALAVAAPLAPARAETRSYVGTVSESMCKHDHAAMKITPTSKCVTDCIRMAKNVRYVLLVGTDSYLLSDQQTPAGFAGKKVRVKGTLHTKTNVLQVERIEAAK